MADERDAKIACEDLNGTTMDGQKIKVEISHGKGSDRRRDDRHGGGRRDDRRDGGYRGGRSFGGRRDHGGFGDRRYIIFSKSNALIYFFKCLIKGLAYIFEMVKK